jgi:ribosomal protein L34
MEIDVRKLSPEARRKLAEDIQKADEEERQAYKHEFVQMVVEAAVEKGVRWSEAAALISSYQPKNDKEAKKLGYKYKGKDKESKDVYYVRKLKGAEPLA